MPQPAPTFEVFGFPEPTVKSGEVLAPIQTIGGRIFLHGSLETLARFALGILRAVNCAGQKLPAVEDRAAMAAVTKPTPAERAHDPRFLNPETEARYLAAWVEWKMQKHRSLYASCAAHGLKYHRVQSWTKRRGAELQEHLHSLLKDQQAAAASLHDGTGPLLKPSGKIL